ncbi:MAG: hypothetical protein JRF33_20485 [Deltaproteobacteria bacterium]|nr:hypothetical protein [Deltaproteobacteria bacterium]
MNETSLKAIDFADAAESLVDSAERLASVLLEKLGGQEKVTISLVGLRGVSSSYFNVVLSEVVSVYGIDAIGDRIEFLFDSYAQELVLGRSMASIRQQHVAA